MRKFVILIIIMKNIKSQELLPKKWKIWVICLTLCFIVAGISLATMISGLLYRPTGTSADKIGMQTIDLYFLSLNKSQLASSAQNLAPDYQAIGAGGYVWKEGDYYHVISSCYENKNDAVLVQNNLSASDLPSEIISLKFSGFNIAGTFSQDEKKVLSKASSSLISAYRTLYDIAISLDTAVYNEISARLAINSTHATLATIKADFDTLFSNSEQSTLSALSNALKSAESITAELCSGRKISRNQTYSSLIKYRYIQLLDTCYSLCQSLNTP